MNEIFFTFQLWKTYIYYEHNVQGVGKKRAAMHAASHTPKAVLQAAKAGVAAIIAPGTVPNVNPAAAKQATATAAHPA